MATIPKAIVEEYVGCLKSLTQNTQSTVLAQLEDIKWNNLDELRARVYETLLPYIQSSADMSEAIACVYYDMIRQIQVPNDGYSASPQGIFNAKAFEVATKAAGMTDKNKFSQALFQKDILDRAGWEIKHAAGETVVGNTKSDPRKPKYARVPTGMETCAFCIMLAGRGFIYSSAKAAGGEGNHYHSNCDCAIIQGYGNSASVEHYDPDYYYDIYERNKVKTPWDTVDVKATLKQMQTELNIQAELEKADMENG